MDQLEILEMQQEFKDQFCLACLPDDKTAGPEVLRLVIETSNYRVEIEIG
ncbi:MAG: hypothetical protein JW757_06425 [Anaerolineales bacterium]|nr:hypothetical protein [Anaerolineales bacterium]